MSSRSMPASRRDDRLRRHDEFARMKKGAFLRQHGRGPLFDYAALTEALESGHLRGAAIETFGIEPVPTDWPLLQLPNVTLTPHIAGASIKTIKIAANAAAEENPPLSCRRAAAEPSN